MATSTINNIIQSNNKAVAAIDKYLSSHPNIVLAGKPYTPAELKAVLQSETAALAAVDEPRLRYRRLVNEARAAKQAASAARIALKAFLAVQFGPSAVDVIGEFGFSTKAKQARSAATAAKAVAKAKATRLARHTMGKKQRLAIKAPVQPAAPTDPVVVTGH